MKIVISESQYDRLIETQEEQKVLTFPGLLFFNNNPRRAWDTMQRVLELKGNPPYSIRGDLDLRGLSIESLGNLVSVGGYLDLFGSRIKSLGNLQSVGGDLILQFSGEIESLGNLESVRGDLYLENTPISDMYSKKQIHKMVNVEGDIYLGDALFGDFEVI